MKLAFVILALSAIASAKDHEFTLSAHVFATSSQTVQSGDTAITNTYTHDTYGHTTNYRRVALVKVVVNHREYDLSGRKLVPIGDYRARMVEGKHRELDLQLPDGKVAKYSITGENEIDPSDPLGIR